MSRKRKPGLGAGKPAGAPPPPPEETRPLAQSWIWVEEDGAAGKRIFPHTVTLAIDADAPNEATLDLFVERGGKEFSGLTVQALRARGVRRAADLAGKELVDPPPSVLSIGPLGAPKLGCGVRAENPLRHLAQAPEPEDLPVPDQPPDMDAEEAAPDDDPALGDIETYRRRRAEEGKREIEAPDPELDVAALAEADAAAAAERALVAPGQAYEVTSIRLRFGALRGGAIEIDVEGRCAAIDDRGEVERADVPFGGHLIATIEA